LLVTGPLVKNGVDLGTRETFADLGQTIAENFGVGAMKYGSSFLGEIA
jgi:phosphopentomutase